MNRQHNAMLNKPPQFLKKPGRLTHEVNAKPEIRESLSHAVAELIYFQNCIGVHLNPVAGFAVRFFVGMVG